MDETTSSSRPASNDRGLDSPPDGDLEKVSFKESTNTTFRAITGLKWVLLSIAILSSTFLYALDNTIMANIRPPIIEDLGHIEKLPWITVAYALGEVSSNPMWGKLYGRFDNKILYCASVAIFDVGSAVCGAAPSPNALIVGRVVAGVGGSGIYIGTINIFSALTLVNERALYLSFVGIAWCMGTILGPIIGGAFADSSATWRWAFYLNLCISAVSAPAYLWYLPPNPSHVETGTPALRRLRSMDFVGGVLFMGAALALIMAISFGGAVYAWGNSRIIGLLVGSAVLWALFALQQGRCLLTTRADRLFPAHLVRSRTMLLLFAETAIGISLAVVPLYFVPLFFQFVRGDSALRAGVRTLPFIFATVVGCLLNGALFVPLSVYAPWFAVGGALGAVGAGLLCMLGPATSAARIYGFSVLVGLGGGLFAQAGYAVGQAKQPAARHAQVTAFLSCAQMAGVALSLGIGTSIFVNRATAGIAAALPGVPHARVQETMAGTGSAFLASLDNAERERVFAVIAGAVRDVFYMTVVVSGLGVLLSLLMKWERLFPAKQTDAEE